MTNEELKTLLKIIKILAPKYKFGSYEVEDIEQEAYIIGLDGYSRWDGIRPLENFLTVHISNRLSNFKRDNYYRFRKCKVCNNIEPLCEKCQLSEKNKKRKLLLQETTDEEYIPLTEDNELNEIEHLINERIPLDLREDYLRLKNGVSISNSRKQRILSIIKDIYEQ